MTALEIVETGEIVEPMAAEEASSITTQIVVKLDAIADNYQAVMPLIRQAITRQAYVVLGYASAGAYVADRFGKALSRLGMDTRRQVVKELTEAGLSTRAIAPVVGVDQTTVVRDLSRRGDASASPEAEPDPDAASQPEREPDPDTAPMPDAEFTDDDDEPALTEAECEALADLGEPEPERITGMDGKSYPKPEPREPREPNRKPLPDAFWRAAFDLGKKVNTLTNLAADDRFKRNADQIRQETLPDLIRARDELQLVIDQLTI